MKNALIILFLSFLSLLIVSCNQTPTTSGLVGSPAPNFSLADMKGNTWTLADLKGQVVFLNFWATWCSPCREEMPAMQRLMDTLPQEKFKMLAVLNRDTPSNANLFVQKSNISIPIINDMANNIGQQYGLTGLPETFIIDKQGIVRKKYIGPAKWDSPQVVQMLMDYINE